MNISSTLSKIKKLPRKIKNVAVDLKNIIKNTFVVRHFKKIIFIVIFGVFILFFCYWLIAKIIANLIFAAALETGRTLFPDFNLREFLLQIKEFILSLF